MRATRRMRNTTVIAVAISAAITISCRTPTPPTPHRCRTKAEWANYGQVALEKRVIFAPDANNQPTRFDATADRIDYLEAECLALNAYVDELERARSEKPESKSTDGTD